MTHGRWVFNMSVWMIMYRLGYLALLLSFQGSAFADMESDLAEYRLSLARYKLSQVDSGKSIGQVKYDYAILPLKRAQNRNQLYRLFIDKSRLSVYENLINRDQWTVQQSKEYEVFQKRPEKLFDVAEPNYFTAMTRTFDSVLRNEIDTPFDLDLVIKFHDHAIDGVLRDKTKTPFKKGIALDWSYPIPIPQLVDQAGIDLLSELFEEQIIDSASLREIITAFVKCQVKNVNLPVSHSILESKVQGESENQGQSIEGLLRLLAESKTGNERLLLMQSFQSGLEKLEVSETSLCIVVSKKDSIRLWSNLRSHLYAFMQAQPHYFETPLGRAMLEDLIEEQKYTDESNQIQDALEESNATLDAAIRLIHHQTDDPASREDRIRYAREKQETNDKFRLKKKAELEQKIQSLREKLQPLLKEIVKQRLKSAFDEFHHKMKGNPSLNEALRSIASLLRKMEMYHIFPDGNQRTHVFLNLNKFLIQNGYPPAILEDNSVFDGDRSIPEIVSAIKKGIENYLNLRKEILVGDI